MATKLAAGAYGGDVAALHSQLKAIGFDIPNAEAGRTFFGAATAMAVRKLQQAAQLPVTGTVDAATSNAIAARMAAVTGARAGRLDERPPTASDRAGQQKPGASRPAAPKPVWRASQDAGGNSARRSTGGSGARAGAAAGSGRPTQREPLGARLAKLLATSPSLSTNQKLQADFTARYSSFAGSQQALLKQLAEDPEFAGALPELQLTLQLGKLTSDNTALMSALRAEVQPKSLQDLVKLTREDWSKLIETPVDGQPVAVPAAVAGKTRDEQVASYVGSIVGQLKSQFPAAYLAQDMAVSPSVDVGVINAVLAANPSLNPAKPLPANVNWSGIDQQQAEAAMSALRKEITAFPTATYRDWLSNSLGASLANPVRQATAAVLAAPASADFDIRTTRIDAEHVPALQQLPASLQAPVTVQLKSLQRLSRLTANYNEIYALQSGGKHSASSVASMPQGAFLNTFAPVLGGRAKAQVIYSKATSIYATLTNLHMRLTDAISGPNFGIFGDLKTETQQALSTIPDLAALFGGQSSCQCDECSALDGPAAYFVDLMNFLAQGVPGQTAPAAGQAPWMYFNADVPIFGTSN